MTEIIRYELTTDTTTDAVRLEVGAVYRQPARPHMVPGGNEHASWADRIYQHDGEWVHDTTWCMTAEARFELAYDFGTGEYTPTATASSSGVGSLPTPDARVRARVLLLACDLADELAARHAAGEQLFGQRSRTTIDITDRIEAIS